MTVRIGHTKQANIPTIKGCCARGIACASTKKQKKNIVNINALQGAEK
jgi:hypothetical protein